MKTFFVTLVALSLALIIGCQENLVNEPETSLDKKISFSAKNTIVICCKVQDPLSGSCNLKGYVLYTHDVLNRTMNPAGLHEISLNLEMDSELCDMLGLVHKEWRIRGKSHDIVQVSEEGFVLVDKTYRITNRNDVVLYVRYMVTTDGVGISSITIAEIEK